MAKKEDSTQTVMVVDDTDDVREIMALQLKILGYRVVEAANGMEAVEIAERECPALILMDINMPMLDGLAATRLIREIAEICDVIIVAFSALGSGDNRERALAAGCNDYLKKPVGFDQLTNLLRYYLSTG